MGKTCFLCEIVTGLFLRPDIFVLQLSAFTTKASVYKALALGGQQHCFFIVSFLFFPIDTPSNPASLFDRIFSFLFFILRSSFLLLILSFYPRLFSVFLISLGGNERAT